MDQVEYKEMKFTDFLAKLGQTITVEDAIGKGKYSEVNGKVVENENDIIVIYDIIGMNNWVLGEPH